MGNSKGKQDETWRARLDVVAKDVVVTDPCYFIKGEQWSEFCRRELDDALVRPKTATFGGAEMLLASTIYGDWMCELNGRRAGRKHGFGTFTADSGMVCVATFDGADPRTVLGRLPKRCWTVIPQFTGTLSISHVARRCTVRGRGRSGGKDVEFHSIQVG